MPLFLLFFNGVSISVILSLYNHIYGSWRHIACHLVPRCLDQETEMLSLRSPPLNLLQKTRNPRFERDAIILGEVFGGPGMEVNIFCMGW